jgi:hypothetical protein
LGFQPPKKFLVAPALDAIAVGLFFTVKSRSKQSFMHALLRPACRKGETTLAILKSPPKPPKNETLQIRIEEHVRSRLATTTTSQKTMEVLFLR